MKHLSLRTADALQYQRNSINFIALVLFLTLITGSLSSGFAQLVANPASSRTTRSTQATDDSAITTASPFSRSQTVLPPSSDQQASNTVSYNQMVPQQDGTPVQAPQRAPISVLNVEPLIASIFSGTTVIIILLLCVIALLVAHKINSPPIRVSGKTLDHPNPEKPLSNDASTSARNISADQGLSMVPANGALQMGNSGQKANVQLPVAAPASLYGAYRIDQEVGKLVLGQPHRMDVLSSRAPDDRRAFEASLIKALSSVQADEPVKRRAREALEEYGFVARQSAAMLMAPDAFDRTLAARTLGEIQSPVALPFLLEALYDHEAIVRNQAVLSIGELRIPSAIGALLDMARKHPDVPGSLLSRALGACSLDGLDLFDAPSTPSGLVSSGSGDTVVHEIEQLEPPALVEELPESSEDEHLKEALAKLDSEEFEERSKAVKELGQFPVQVAVKQLALTARRDPYPGIRALAVGSLAAINHESVFPSVLIGMADESREVRAAAARALSRLGFSRADAYVRVLETADADTLTDVAQACIQAGIVYQEIERLASTDRRQVYEAFSLLTLIARAELIEPILEGISNHQNIAVRLAALRWLSSCATPIMIEKLRELVSKEGMDEEVTTALLELLYKFDQVETPDSQESGNGAIQPDAEPTVEVGKASLSADELPRHDPNVDEVDT